MNPPDYRADLRVRCLIPTNSNFTKHEIYECFSISSRGTAKVKSIACEGCGYETTCVCYLWWDK